MKRAVLTLLCLVVMTWSALAGDLSTFQSLGFSNDGSYFAFGYYGVQGSGKSYANLTVVDVKKNAFVKESDKELQGKEPVSLGQDGSSSLLKLVIDQKQLLEKYSINLERSGRPIYVLLNTEDAKDNLVFTDFTTKNLYNVSLIQKTSNLGASFSIQFSITDPANVIKTFTVGKPLFVRPNILGYKIRQIVLSPSEKELIFIIEKNLSQTSATFSNSWMIEAIQLK